MQKLKNAILDKFIEARLTDAELEVLLYLAHRQSEQGTVIAYYRSVCEALGIAHQTFYNALSGLRDKGIICYQKKDYTDLDILILDNDCSDIQKTAKEGYLNINEEMFCCRAFRKLKVNEKLMAMYLYKVAKSGGRSYRIGVWNLYSKFQQMFGVGKRTIQRYLTSLRSLFHIGIRDGKYWITPRKTVSEGEKRTDKELLGENVIETIFRRNRAKYSARDYADVLRLFGQYFGTYQRKVAPALARAVYRSLFLRNENRHKYKWDRQVHPAYIHKLLREELGATV